MEFLKDLWQFMKQRKVYWLAPIIIIALLLGVFFVFASTGLAPFIYSLF
jgi:hypothetical protein